MDPGSVHDDDVARFERWPEVVSKAGEERVVVDVAREGAQCADAVARDGTDEGTLQPTTLPPEQGLVDAAKDAAKGVGVLLVGGLVVTAGALLLPSLPKR